MPHRRARAGKTTLLAQAIAENHLSPRGVDVWIGIEAADADADRLARAVASTLTDSGEVSGATDTALADPAWVADAMWQRSPSEACLVFDDVHLLPAASTGAAWLGRLVQALPANGHVVLASRSTPPIPLSRLGAQGAVLWLDEDDLLFDGDEMSGFAHMRGIDPADFGDTGGWPAMAELTATVDRRLTGAFLWEEVLEPLGNLRRHVLAVLSDLDGADDELASAAVGVPVDLAVVLDGVPLVARGVDGWYRPHGLWRTAPGMALSPVDQVEARTQAVDHLISRGRFDDAFGLIEGAGMWEAAPGLLRTACLSSDRLVASQLRRWLSGSTEEVRSSTAGLLATGMHAALTSPENAVAPLSEAAGRYREEGDVDAEMTAVAQLGRLAWIRQDGAALGALAGRVAELEPGGHPAARALATFGRAMVADMLGDDAAVLSLLDSIEPSALDSAWEILASFLYATVSLDLGDRGVMYRAVERHASTAEPTLRPVLDALELAAWWADGRVDDVLGGIPAAEVALRATSSTYILYVGLIGSANAFAITGDVAGARRYLDEAARIAPPTPVGSMTVRMAVCTAQLRLAEGDEPAAVAILREAIDAHQLDHGVDRHMWRQNLSLSYVLVPESRPHWDAAPLRGHLLVARELARAVVALRDGGVGSDGEAGGGGGERGDDVLRALHLDGPGPVRSSLHLRFAAELAVGLAAVGRDEGPALLDALGPMGRDAVRAIAAATPRWARRAKSLLAAVPASPPQTAYLRVLGPFVLCRAGPDGDEVVVPELRRKKLQELLAFLVGHRRTNRSAITAALWPDLDERAAGNNLAVTLNHLLRLLEPHRAAGEPGFLVRLEGQSVRLVTGDHLHIDVDDFDRHITAAAVAEVDGLPSLALEHDLAAVVLYRGDLHHEIPEAYWFSLDREHYRSRFVTAAVRAGQLLLGRGEIGRAEDIAHQALAVDHWCEPAYAVLVGAALARDDRSAATRMLRRCTDALADLGATPSEPTRQLERRIS